MTSVFLEQIHVYCLYLVCIRVLSVLCLNSAPVFAPPPAVSVPVSAPVSARLHRCLSCRIAVTSPSHRRRIAASHRHRIASLHEMQGTSLKLHSPVVQPTRCTRTAVLLLLLLLRTRNSCDTARGWEQGDCHPVAWSCRQGCAALRMRMASRRHRSTFGAMQPLCRRRRQVRRVQMHRRDWATAGELDRLGRRVSRPPPPPPSTSLAPPPKPACSKARDALPRAAAAVGVGPAAAGCAADTAAPQPRAAAGRGRQAVRCVQAQAEVKTARPGLARPARRRKTAPSRAKCDFPKRARPELNGPVWVQWARAQPGRGWARRRAEPARRKPPRAGRGGRADLPE
jgi:hypothetical protein